MFARLIDYFKLDRTLVSISAAAFTMSAGSGIFFVTAPFVIKNMSGTDGDVGTSMSLYFVANLAMCLTVAFIIGSFNSKRSAQIGAAGCAVAASGMFATLFYAAKLTHPIMTFNVWAILFGVFNALFWPPLVGWLSAEHEGVDLSRRIGSFNIAWSGGSWISPWLGGILVAANTPLPMLVTALIMVLCFASLRYAKNPRCIKPMTRNTCEDFHHIHLARFKWLARIGLVIGFLCAGLIRNQMGILFKFELGYTESSYGLAVTFMALANFIVFWITGRIHAWHYKRWLFAAAIIGLAAGMMIIIECKGLGMLFAASTIIGITGGFLYAAHLFYGLTGSKQRSSLMAVHLFLLSIGLVAGSYVGGHLSDAFGRYMPYWYGVAAVCFAAILQIAVWFTVKSSPVKQQ